MTTHDLLTQGVNFSAIGSGLATGVKYSLVVVAIGLVAYFLWRLTRNNVRVYVHKHTAGGYKRIRTWGRETTDKTGKVLGFEVRKFPKYDGRKVPEDYIGSESSGLFNNKSRAVVDMHYTTDGNLVPIKPPAPKDPTWKMLGNPEIQVYNNARDAVEKRFDLRSFWDKYGAIALQMGVIMIVVIIFIVVQENLGNLIAQAGSASAMCQESLSACQTICSNAQSISAGGGAVV